MTSPRRRILVVASTFPAGPDDPVPSFVRDLIVETRRVDPSLDFTVLAPHDPRSSTAGLTRHPDYDEYRFQYFWPRRAQVLAGRGGIVPSLRRNRALYALVPFFLLAEGAAIRRLIRRLKPDVLNAHWIIPQGVVAAAARGRRGVPLLLSVHGGDVFTFDAPLARRAKTFAMRRAAGIVVNSSATREKVLALMGSTAPTVVPMGVQLDRFAAVTTRTTHTALRVLFVGRLSEEKGVRDLLDAVVRLRDRGVDVQVRIAGTGPQEKELRGQVSKAGLDDVVEFLGWVAQVDIPDQYRWADVFAGPSVTSSTGWVEALGVVLIEAAATGLPVVATATGGIRDVVIDGKTGIIVDERSPDQLADALQTLAADPALRRRLGTAARTHVENSFAWPQIARSYAEEYRRVMGPSRED
jgi:glycosyltransferase involved in cell wall biosynthesis